MIGEARLRRRPQHRSLLSQQRRHVSVCDAAEQRAMSQFGLKLGHPAMSAACPLFPRKRKSIHDVVRLTISSTVSADIRSRVDALADQIKAGTVTVPTTWNGAEFPNP